MSLVLLKLVGYTLSFCGVVYIEEIYHWDERKMIMKKANEFMETKKIRMRCFLVLILITIL